MDLNQNLSEFFDNSNSGSGGATPTPAPAKPGLSSDLSGFFDRPAKPAAKTTSKPTNTAGGFDTSVIDGVAEREGLTPTQRTVMAALLHQESNNGKNAVTSIDGARGAGQIMPATFRQYAKPGEDINNTEHNLAVMARIVKDLGGKSGDDPAKIAVGYFSGEGNINRGAGNPWRNDAADGNGKRVSAYAADVVARMAGVPAAKPAAAAAKPDLSKAPKWADIVQKPEFQKLTDDVKAAAKERYFDYWIAPHGGDAELRARFLAMKDAEQTSLLGQAADAVMGAGKRALAALTTSDVPVDGTDPALKGSVMAGVPRQDVPIVAPTLDPAYQRSLDAKYNAATPEQRARMGQAAGPTGDYIRAKDARYAAQDKRNGEFNPNVGAPSSEVLDPRAEKRSIRLAREGMDSSLTDAWARTGAARGELPGEEIGQATKSTFDFDTQEKFNKDPFYSNPVVRGAVKGYAGFKQGALGVNQFVAEVVGADDFAATNAAGARESRAFTDAMGTPQGRLQRNFEGAISSIAQQLPALLGGAATGSQALVLGSMFATTFGQEYADGRARGQSTAEATIRAGLFGSFEVIGERFGLKFQLAAMRQAASGVPTGLLSAWMANTIKREIPGEMLTTTGQFLTDKLGGNVGLNQAAGWKQYLDQMADTVVQTAMQGGIMGGATGGVAHGVQFLNSSGESQALQATRAEGAREAALNKWSDSPLTQTRAAPVHPTIQAADDAVRELAAMAGIQTEEPAPAAQPEQPAAQPMTQPAAPIDQFTDQDINEFAGARREQLLSQRDGETDYTSDENGDAVQSHTAGTGLTQEEAQELSALERAGVGMDGAAADASVLRAMYGFDQQGQANDQYTNADAVPVQDEQPAGAAGAETVPQDSEAGRAPVAQPDQVGQADTVQAVSTDGSAVPDSNGADHTKPSLINDIDAAAHEAATSPSNGLAEPSQAQKDAGNYKKGHVSIQGLDIAIENPQGSTRSGTSPDGKEWSNTLANHYGYIKRTEGADGDHVDTFIGPNPDSTMVFVVDQIDPATGKFDEHKVMVGFDSKDDADAAYHANYEKGWAGRGAVTGMSMDHFKGWLKDSDTTRPFAVIETRESKTDVPEPAQVRQEEKTQTGTQSTPAAEEVKPKTEKEAREAREDFNDAIVALDDLPDVDLDVMLEGGSTDMAELMRALKFTEQEIADELGQTEETQGGAGTGQAATSAAPAGNSGIDSQAEVAPKTEKEAKAKKNKTASKEELAHLFGTVQRKQIPDMTDAELVQMQSFYGPDHKRTPKIQKEIAKRAKGAATSENSSPVDLAPKTDDLNAMFDDVLAEETAKAEKPKTEKQAKARKVAAPGAAAVSAARNAGAGLTESIDALGKLFGGKGTLGSGPVFNDETYAAAKPHFQKAVAHFQAAGTDLKEAMRAVVRMVLDKFGAEATANMKPYVVRFMEDYRDGKVENSTNSDDTLHNQAPIGANGGRETNSLDQSGIDKDQPGVAGGEPSGTGSDGPLAGESTQDGKATASDKRAGSDGARSDAQGSGNGSGQPAGGDAANGRNGTSGTGLADAGAGGPVAGPARADYFIADPESLIGGTPKVRFARNKAAITAFNDITAEGREPTQEELDSMAAYIGWGSFGQELFQGTWSRPMPKAGWEKESAWLREHMGEESWKSAQSSIINAHYTDPITVGTMWDMVRAMGFKGGRVLEPSMGIGNFFGLMPRDLAEKSSLTGIELDKTTGGMAKLLYPNANIQIKGYEESKTADDFYDLVIGNWPFAKDTPFVDRRYMRLDPSLHDYFFLKALDQVRPGGIVIGITSAGTMDKKGRATRMELAKKGELIASYRLPSGAFEKYAGTAVVTDIIILRKRDTPSTDFESDPWIDLGEFHPENGPKFGVNSYYLKNPGNILGQLDYGNGTTYGRAAMIVRRPADLEQRMAALASKMPADGFKPHQKKENISYITNNLSDREGSITTTDGKLFVVRGEQLAPLADVVKYKLKDDKKTAEREQQIHALIDMRKDYAKLIDAEREGAEDTEKLRKSLHAKWKEFNSQFGPVTESDGLNILRQAKDPFYASLAALESAPGKPAAILKESTIRAKKKLANPSVLDAFVMARNESMDVDIAAIAAIAKKTEDEVAAELEKVDAIYKTPAGNYEVADAYLSGNVRRKLREAEESAANGVDMARNIAALKKVVPKTVPYFQIEAKFGAPWVKIEHYRAFIAEMLGLNKIDDVEVRFTAGSWKVKFLDSNLNFKPEAQTQWGMHPGQVRFDKMLTAAMNNRTVKVTVKDEDGNKVVDEEATKAANDKVSKLREHFSTWVWSDAERRVWLEQNYNEVMNAIATPKFDGSFLEFAGMALRRGKDAFSLRSHQVNAIWRGLVNGRGIYAHEVGTGKTYTMAGLAVESRRYGLAKKPLIFAHNANSATVAREINDMYPGAKILYIDNLAPKDIDVTMRKIANDDWDAVVVPHSQIDRFALTEKTLREISAEEIAAMEQEALDAAQDDGVALELADMDDPEKMKKVRSVTAKELVKARNNILKKIAEMAARSTKEGAVSFEDLGVDMIIVDEAHEFKKPPITTKMQMRGLNKGTSNQSISLRFLTDYVKRQGSGRGVHTFSGTPITNTLTEIYNQMRYVMDDQMARDGIKDWDSWFNTFADSTSDVELTATGEYEPITRLASFVNTAELRRIVGQYMDIVFADDMPEFKPRPTASGKIMKDDLTDSEKLELLNGRMENPVGRPYKKIITDVAPLGAQQKIMLQKLVGLANLFKNAPKKDRREMMASGHPASPLLVETAAANAGMDPRLVEMEAADEPASKANRVVNNVKRHYDEHPGATQVIFLERGFSDYSTKTKTLSNGDKVKTKVAKFNLVKDIVNKLVATGIKSDQIAIVDGSTSKEKRKEIADKMNKSEIRVVIGNTDTLGVGVNMQTNLRAMHHLDAPWMPGELEQRNGRGHRQGNKWNTVLEYRYITEKLDGRRWQVLAVKDRFIKSFLKADESVRVIDGDAVDMEDGDEAGDLAATLSEAAGDPRILIREKLKADLSKLENRERLHTHAIADAKSHVRSLSDYVPRLKKEIADLDADIAQYAKEKEKPFSIELGGKIYDDRKEADEALSKLHALHDYSGPAKGIGQYAGFKLRLVSDILKITHVQIVGAGNYETSTASMAALGGTLRANTGRANTRKEKLADTVGSIARLEEVQKQPFAQADTLEKKKKMLVDLEADLQNNPVPAPSWLRHSAPVGAEIYVDGKPRVVEGHQWGTDDYYVITEQGRVPYLSAKDAAGMPLYEPQEFEPPVKESAAEKPATEKPAVLSQSTTTRMPFDKWLSVSVLAQIVENHLKKLGHKPNVIILDRDSEVIGDAAADDNRGASGLVYDGKIYLFRDSLADTAEVVRTLWHELLHYGLRRFLTKEQYISEMQKLYDRDLWIRRAADGWVNGGSAAAEDAKKQGVAYARARGVDEALAELAETNKGGHNYDTAMSKVRRTVLNWIAAIADRFGYADWARACRAVGHDDARKLVKEIFSKMTQDAAPTSADWAGADPTFSIRSTTAQSQADLIKEFGKPTYKNIDWWDKSVGTQYHKAAKNPHFKKVFDIALARENAVSLTSIRAAELAPAFLPRVDDFKSAAMTLIKGKSKGKQMHLAADAILAGTLQGESVLDGKVWTEQELRDQFGMDDEGVMHYQQVRAAIDASLNEVAAAEGFAALQLIIPRGLREQVISDPANAKAILTDAIEKRIRMDKARLKAAEAKGAGLEAIKKIEADIVAAKDARDTMTSIFKKAKQLKVAGYAPLMRFGQFTVSAMEVDPMTGKIVINPETGEPNALYFARFETEAEAQADYLRQSAFYRGQLDVSVKSGPANDEKYKMYQGLSPETLALFAEEVGAKDAMKKLYQVAISERSALKRRLERKNIAGFSRDMPRVLANFITSNGRFSAQRYYTRDFNNAIKYIPSEKGDVQKEAQRLKEYLDNPKDGGAMASTLAFTWFLGGNIASAAVNATQPVMMTLPYLAQWGAKKAAAAIATAAPYAMGKKQITDSTLRNALKRASQEGKVDAQEIFHLYSVGIQGVVSSMANKLSKVPLIGDKVKAGGEDLRARGSALLTLWGMPFAMVEGFNRRLTFIAAWDMAQQTNQPDPYEFAVRAVDETQGVYNKVNRPNWARSTGGRMVFTFTQFKIMNVELVKRMLVKGGPEGKKAIAAYVAIMVLAAGLGGLPYADDLDDLIDTLGQLLGFDTNMKRTKREWAYQTLGKFWGDLSLYGVSSHLPFDFGGRLGLGNMIPGTGIMKPSDENNRTRQIAELFGPLAGMVSQIGDAYDAFASDNFGKMGESLMPTAIKNAMAGAGMAATGEAKDYRGRKKADVTMADAVSKAIGFNPTVIAQKNRANMPIQQDIALQKQVEAGIVEMWARGVAEDKQNLVDQAQQKMENWNRKNPETPVSITAKQITSAARTLMTPTDTRLMKAAPKEMRGRVAAGLDTLD